MLEKSLWQELGLPIILHGDKVPYTKYSGMIVISFSFLLAKGLPMLDICYLVLDPKP